MQVQRGGGRWKWVCSNAKNEAHYRSRAVLLVQSNAVCVCVCVCVCVSKRVCLHITIEIRFPNSLLLSSPPLPPSLSLSLSTLSLLNSLSLSLSTPTVVPHTFDALLKVLRGGGGETIQTFSPFFSPSLLRRLEVAFAEFEVAFHSTVKLEGDYRAYVILSLSLSLSLSFSLFLSHSLPPRFSKNLRVPKKVETCDWMSANVLRLYEATGQMYLLIQNECTEKGCSDTKGSPSVTFLWAPGKGEEEGVSLSAPKYFTSMRDWIESQVGF